MMNNWMWRTLIPDPYYLLSGDPLTMGYFDNLDNGLLNEKQLIDVFFYFRLMVI
jgi:hypothetical protein